MSSSFSYSINNEFPNVQNQRPPKATQKDDSLNGYLQRWQFHPYSQDVVCQTFALSGERTDMKSAPTAAPATWNGGAVRAKMANFNLTARINYQKILSNFSLLRIIKYKLYSVKISGQ